MTVINTNVASLNAQSALASNARGLQKAMEQLSTGKRINSASDDAAGLAISTRLTSQIRGLNQAVRNANDGIAMIQTAEGAAVEITNMLQRMRELAIQSANDTNTDEDRDFLDLEFQQLKEEIDRIAETTQWNGMEILDGSFASNSGTFVFQVGANAAQTVDITIANFTSAASDLDLTGIASAIDADVQTTTLTLAGTMTAGDVITFSANGKQAQYTLSEADTASGKTLTDLATTIAARGDIAETLGVTLSSDGDDLEFVGAEGETFSFSASANSGMLADIATIDVQSRANADLAITAIDNALFDVNEQRATMGATVNRLQYTVDNLTNVSNKATESRSRVLDTDYSQATTELSKRQIISQAATAMLAQANQQPQTVLSLLK